MDNYQENFVVAGNKEIDESETLECQVCHAIMRQITHKHLKRHKMTTEEYKLKFPSHPLMTAYRRSFYENFKHPNKGKTYEEIYGKDEAKIKKLKISKNQIGRACPKLAGTGISGTRKDTNTFARSTYEANIDRVFIFENKRYANEFSIKRFGLIRKNGDKISYCPDRVDQDGLFCKGAYLEIKGYMHPNDWEKIQLFREQYPIEKLIVISTDESYCDINYKTIKEKYKPKIALWETDKQNYKNRPDLYLVGYETPERVKFYQQNYPNNINILITDPHLVFIANKCLSYNKVSIGQNPYIEKVELIAITNKRSSSSKISTGEYNYELWRILTTNNEIFYVTNINKTVLFYCHKEDKFESLMSFFKNNCGEGLKHGRKYEKTHEYITSELWNNANDHLKYILQLINDRIRHRGEENAKIVTKIKLNKKQISREGAMANYEEWFIYCGTSDTHEYILTNFDNATTTFLLINADKPK